MRKGGAAENRNPARSFKSHRGNRTAVEASQRNHFNVLSNDDIWSDPKIPNKRNSREINQKIARSSEKSILRINDDLPDARTSECQPH
jgi:hypothetical protein